MPYPNMLRLCFWFGLSYSLVASAGTIGATLINSSLIANPNTRLDSPREREAPVCVDNAQHPKWGVDLDGFAFATCQHAVELLKPSIASFLYNSYDFYSRRVYPAGIGAADAWPLVQGTATAGCVLVIRMTRDFASDSLPTPDGRFAPTRRAQDIQQSSWVFLFRTIENLLSVCVQGKGLPGWSMESKNIVVALWPRSSDIDKAYGLRVISPEPDMNTSWLVLNP